MAFVAGSGIFAQNGPETAALTLSACEEALQKNKLQLLSEQYHVSAAQADIVQARIWEQPVLSADWNAYNPEADKFFDVRNQKTVAIDQLIYLGGKKRNEVKLARKNAEAAALELESLLFNLKYELRQEFYNLYFDLRIKDILDGQVSKISELLAAYEIQADKGNVALKEVVRLQSLLLDLKNERHGIITEILENRENLRLLTGLDTDIVPVASDKELIQRFGSQLLSPEILLETAREKNPEFKSVLKEIEIRQVNVKLQKSLSVPDINLGFGYDQQSGAFRDEVNMRLGIPLPLWNSNKGNIKVAEAELSRAKSDSEFRLSQLNAELKNAFQLWDENRRETALIKESVYENLELVNQGVLANFQKRNISLNEFTDFMESYNSSVISINQRYKQLILSGEALNHITNSTIFQ